MSLADSVHNKVLKMTELCFNVKNVPDLLNKNAYVIHNYEYRGKMFQSKNVNILYNTLIPTKIFSQGILPWNIGATIASLHSSPCAGTGENQ